MRLAGKDLNARLSKMSKSGGAFNEYIRSQSDAEAMNIKLTRDKQDLLSRAVHNVDSLRQSTKIQLACVKVVNLKQKREEHENSMQLQKEADSETKLSAFKSEVSKEKKPSHLKTSTNINY